MNKDLIRKILREADSSVTAGAFNGPLGLGMNDWKNALAPFTQELSHFTNAENYADSLDGNMDKSKTEVRKMEIIGHKWSDKLKKNFHEEDDDSGGSSDFSISDGEGAESLNEDLAVWFGKKKKKKGSSQPQGPWVNICRKKEGGGHPPCGRGEAKSKGYPKCRAVGVARRMSDAQKKAACQQKRRVEKTNPKTGTGNKPKLVSYKPKKKANENISEAFNVRPNEYKKILVTEDYILVIPFTHNASCKYGAKTKWCTTKRDDATDFEDHITSGLLAYLIIRNPEKAKLLDNEKFAIFRYRQEDKNTGMVYTELNEEHNLEWFKELMYHSGLLSDYNRIMQSFNESYEIFDKGGIFNLMMKLNESKLKKQIKQAIFETVNDKEDCNKVIFEFFKPIRKKWAMAEVCVPKSIYGMFNKYLKHKFENLINGDSDSFNSKDVPEELMDFILGYYKNKYYFSPEEIKIRFINWATSRAGEQIPKVSIEYRFKEELD